MQGLHEAEFILRAGAGENIVLLRGVAQLTIVHRLQLTSGNSACGVTNPQHLPNAHRRLRVVAGDHFHADPGLQAVGNGGNGLRTRGIHHPGDTEQNNTILQVRVIQLTLSLAGGFPGRSHHAQPLAGILFNLPFPVWLIERLQSVIRLLVLAETEQDVRRAGE